jgi:transforming growth factor-beta-induced protein
MYVVHTMRSALTVHFDNIFNSRLTPISTFSFVQLQDLLLLHVLAGEFFAIDFSDNLVATTLNGEKVTILLPPLTVNGVKVLDADNAASNGVVHILQGILAPSWAFNTITDRMVADSDLSILLDLLGLAEIKIPSPGAFTLLAPTNAAFFKLPQETIDFLLTPEGKETLVEILLYHVVVGIYTSSEVEDGSDLPTLQGDFVDVTLDPVMFSEAGIVEVDILAANGVVHKIDTVLNPRTPPFPFDPSIVDVVVGNPDLTALTAAVMRAGLVDALNGPGPFTLFAPNDDAFGAVPVGLLELLLTNDEFIPHVRSTHNEIRVDNIFNSRLTTTSAFFFYSASRSSSLPRIVRRGLRHRLL